MLAILLRRVPSALVTLFVLSLLVFGGGQLLPGDVGRAVLGPLADPRAVAALDHQLGADRPALVQYADWAAHLLRGDLGQSFAFRSPVAPFVGAALLASLKLGAVAFALVVPLGILGGVVAALNRGRWLDRAIVLFGLSATVVPEFVSGIVLILVLGIGLRWFPITATPPDGAGPATQLYYLVLPAVPLVLVVFGYIARMARAGTAEALDSDYARTAVLKGVARRDMVRRHVLRNALLPTITVVASQSVEPQRGSFNDTLSAAIATNPNFTAALAAAISSIIGGPGGSSTSGVLPPSGCLRTTDTNTDNNNSSSKDGGNSKVGNNTS